MDKAVGTIMTVEIPVHGGACWGDTFYVQGLDLDEEAK